MSDRNKYPHLDSELIEIFDDYQKALENGELPIVNGHVTNTSDPTQVWGKHVSEKMGYLA